MKFAHRLRMFWLMRKANIILNNSQRPYIASNHLVGYPDRRVPDTGITPFYVALAILAVGLVVYINVYYPDRELNVGCYSASSK